MARFLTVTPNPAIDVTYRVDRQIIGETLRVSDVRRGPGGKGINVARVLRALGRDVTALQPLGGTAGRWIADALAQSGIPVIDCPVSGETRTTVALVDDVAHPTLLAEPGPALTPAEWTRLADALAHAAHPGDWVVIAGSFPAGSRPEDLALLIEAAHSRQAFAAVDTSGPLLASAAAARPNLVKANAQEILEATGAPDAASGARALARGGASVVMSRGSRGSLLVRPDGTTHEQSAVPGVDGNPTGAGDAATAGLVAALGDGHGASTALRWAALCGAGAVLSPVAGELDVDLIPLLSERLGSTDAAPLTPSSSKRSST